MLKIEYSPQTLDNLQKFLHTHHDHIQNIISIMDKYKLRIIVHRNEVDGILTIGLSFTI